jgi:hypothetical protein
MKKDNIDITLGQIKNYLNKQSVEQVSKIQHTKHDGHIVAFFANECWQMDIFDLSKYEKYNKGYKYILAVVDVFTRKAYCVATKTKDELEVIKSFHDIVHGHSILPTMIITDSDSSFLGRKFQKMLKDEDIIHNTVPIGDHASLGIIDRFALTLKRILTKRRQIYDSANWKESLNKVIANYNNTEHKGINNLIPNEASMKTNKDTLYKVNLEKSKSNIIESDLKIGDKVRIRISKTFKKGSEEQFSKEIYIVESVRGKTVYLEGDIKKSRDMLLKVHKDTINTASGITEKVSKERRAKRRFDRAGMDASNVIEARTRGRR